MGVLIKRPPAGEAITTLGRVDGYAKVSGQAAYTDDLKLPDLLYGAVVRSPYAHARIVGVRKAKAEALPGVHAVVTGDELPHGLMGRRVCDAPVLARGVVRFVGEPVVAVAADSLDLAEAAAALVEVDYEPLPAVLTAESALDPDAPRVHEEPWRYHGAAVTPADPPNLQSLKVWEHGGDVEAALAASHRVFTHTFRTQLRHQGYLEPHGCIARVTDGTVELWATHKGPYQLRQYLARWLGAAPQQIQVHPMLVGGDFGGKGSIMVAAIAIVLAQQTGRAVKVRMRYAEDLMAANPRHPATVLVRLGVDQQNRLTAMHVQALVDGGAYAGFKPTPHVNLNGIGLAGNSYRIPALRIESRMVYTHTVPKGHMRAPGSVQSVFAVESLLDMVARDLGVNPAEFRSVNLLRDGEQGSLGENWVEARGEETLRAALAALQTCPPPTDPPEGDWAFGTGIAIYSRDTHYGRTEVALQAEADGSVTAWVPFTDQGAGQLTMARTVVQRQLGLPVSRVRVRQANIDEFEFDSGCSAGRVTVDASVALSDACQELKRRLQEAYGLQAGHTPEQLSEALAAFAREVGERVTASVSHAHGPIPHRPENPDHAGPPDLISYAAHIARVWVDRRTGQVVVDELITAVDVAEILNPPSARAQLVGGVVMSYGDAMLEDLLMEEGKVATGNLGDYRLPASRDLPRMRLILLEGGRGMGPLNVKPVGELTCVGVAPAITNAVADAIGVRIDSLPITAEKIFFALERGGEITKEASR